jgi:hypothetical protein
MMNDDNDFLTVKKMNEPQKEDNRKNEQYWLQCLAEIQKWNGIDFNHWIDIMMKKW